MPNDQQKNNKENNNKENNNKENNNKENNNKDHNKANHHHCCSIEGSFRVSGLSGSLLPTISALPPLLSPKSLKGSWASWIPAPGNPPVRDGPCRGFQRSLTIVLYGDELRGSAGFPLSPHH